MIETTVARSIVNAALYYNEIFKRTAGSQALPDITTKLQVNLMLALYFNGPMNMTALSRRAGIAPEQATRTIRALREKGLVESERSHENQRMVVARLTEKGAELMNENEHNLFSSLEECLDGLSPEEIEQLGKISLQACALLGKTKFANIGVHE
jgi:DNA-binding MarR family transcriptional regulator